MPGRIVIGNHKLISLRENTAPTCGFLDLFTIGKPNVCFVGRLAAAFSNRIHHSPTRQLLSRLYKKLAMKRYPIV